MSSQLGKVQVCYHNDVRLLTITRVKFETAPQNVSCSLLGTDVTLAVCIVYLSNHEAGLYLAIDVSVLVTQLLPGLHEGEHQRGPPRRFLHCQVTAPAVVRTPR